MPDPNDFTAAQAGDLARYFLGPGWRAAIDADGARLLTDGKRMPFDGSTWRAAFRAAGVHLPLRREFATVKTLVYDGDTVVATASSTRVAERIARALNHLARYHPDEYAERPRTA